MVNNFNQIITYLHEGNTEYFYHLQIIRRGKDHPNLPSANHVIKSYFIDGPTHLKAVQDEIISLCELFRARAYINLSQKSCEKLGKFAMHNLAERIYTGDYKRIWKVFESAAEEIKGINAAWLVDVDDLDIDEKALIACISNCDPVGPKVKYRIPTKSGYHLITEAFNVQQFRMHYQLDVHKNSLTLLYYPKSLD